MNTNTKHKHVTKTTSNSATGAVSIHVALTNSKQWVKFCPAGYAAFIAEYGEAPIFLNSNGTGYDYARFRDLTRQNNGMLARAVKGSPKGKIVYNDGDRLNVRRDNLTPTAGRFKGAGAHKRKRRPAPDEFAQPLGA